MRRWLCLLTVLCLAAVPALASEYTLNGADYSTDLGHNMDEFRDAFDLLYQMSESTTPQWGEEVDLGDGFAYVDVSVTGMDKIQFLYQKDTGKLYAASCFWEANVNTNSSVVQKKGAVIGNMLSAILTTSLYLDVKFDAAAFRNSLSDLQEEYQQLLPAFAEFESLGDAEIEKGHMVNIPINGRVISIYGRKQGEMMHVYIVYHTSEDDVISVPDLAN